MRFTLAGLVVFVLAFGAIGVATHQPRRTYRLAYILDGEPQYKERTKWGWPLTFYAKVGEQARPISIAENTETRVRESSQFLNDPEDGVGLKNLIINLLVMSLTSALISWGLCAAARKLRRGPRVEESAIPL